MNCVSVAYNIYWREYQFVPLENVNLKSADVGQRGLPNLEPADQPRVDQFKVRSSRGSGHKKLPVNRHTSETSGTYRRVQDHD